MADIDFSEPTFRLDLAIAMSIGWSRSDDDRYYWRRPNGTLTNLIPSYSKDATLALEALQITMDMKEIGRSILDITPEGYVCKVGNIITHDKIAAMAICKALHKL